MSSLNPDHLKPMRKRKRKEYLSPSEEDSDIEGTVGQLSYFYSTSKCLILEEFNQLCINMAESILMFDKGQML